MVRASWTLWRRERSLLSLPPPLPSENDDDDYDDDDDDDDDDDGDEGGGRSDDAASGSSSSGAAVEGAVGCFTPADPSSSSAAWATCSALSTSSSFTESAMSWLLLSAATKVLRGGNKQGREN